ncbi:lipase family protein [Prescottella equi]|uniref:Lipase n=1 Tax=Rhodococcus hoagii TaxID=43767 RepID=A0AAE5IUK8_RHOHA|nr:lipase family protein [Prescottella equi]ERN46864.1 lipase [Prescottella equi NBRC 101255 = C 7]MBM4524369.1 lipase [Prescottella equi]MBM4597945.1 lipase [Prescottella equi]MBM4625401.1 lipase [Prescottella equi]MBM4650174.1 lipase [Prescottella equi]
MTRTGALLAVLLCAAALVGCSATADDRTPRTTATQTSQAVAAPDPAERGVVTSAEPFTGEGLSGQKILYRSTSGIDGRGTEVSGTVFVPPGRAPAGGWPVVTVGHPTTGLLDDCAPSRHGNLLGSAGLVRDLLARGYVVAVTDYEGLGTDGPHPYLEPITAGYNLIDAVRAARTLVPDASTRWAAIGVSQGGQAAWAAAERAGRYGDGLEFVGAASLSPPADLSPIVSDGPPNLDVPQQIFLPMLLDGLAVSHPDLDASAYIRGPLADNRDVIRSCTGALASRKLSVALNLTPADTLPRSDEDVARMREWLTADALPQQQASGPLLVVVAGRDNLIRPDWTTAAVGRACGQGDVVELRYRPDDVHADAKALPGAVEWISDRFAGVSASSTCAGQAPR